MKTLPAILLLLLHCLFAADSLQAAASDATNRVRISELPTTNSLQWSNIVAFVVYPYPHPYYTNGTMGINASNLAVSLSPWLTSTGEVTTVQLLAASNTVYSAQAARAPTNNAVIHSSSISSVPLTLFGAAGQDGNMLNVKDSSGNILFAIGYDGVFAGAGANSVRLASTSTAGHIWTASDTTGIGAFAAPAQQTNSSIVRQTELTAASNAAVAFSMTVSNTLYGAETPRNAAVSNAVVAFAMAVSNAVYTTETARNAAVSNAAVAFTMTASNTLYSLIGSGGNTGTSNSIPVVTITTNVNIGFGTMQSLAMTTPSNQFVNFQGTETNGDTVELAVTNSAATNITITLNLDGTTSIYYDPTAGTNRSSFVVSPGGKILTFVYSTNWGAIWRLNAYLGQELELATAKGFGVALTAATNGGAVTLTSTRTNAITYAATNTTSLHIDWTGTEHVIVPNLLETNLVLIPTNMIVGREIYLTFLPGSVSYNISISNAAGTRVRWNISTNSGNAALNKTNVIQVEASLLYQTNGISAAVGRFIN